MKEKSTFRTIFWILLAVTILLASAALVIFFNDFRTMAPGRTLMLVLPLFVAFPAFVIIVGRLVYKDALQRGMDPWLWTTVAVFVPNLIGVIIYLVVRGSAKSACTNCGEGIQKNFKICPYCGQSQEMVCENCKEPVVTGWKVCPKCTHALPEPKSQD